MRRRLTVRERKALRNERAYGASYRKIAQLHRVPKSTVFDYAHDVKLCKSARRHP